MLDKNVVLITTPNRYQKYVNISNPRVAVLYDYFRRRIKSVRFPVDDRQRYLFERMIVNMCRRGEIPVKSWVISHRNINAWNLPMWLEYSSDVIPIDHERGVSYGDVAKELCLINAVLFVGPTCPATSEDYEILERIELTDAKLYAKLIDILERGERHGRNRIDDVYSESVS